MKKAGYEKTEPCLQIGEANFPAPFKPGLEYNSPAHGVWNIVHTGMLIPGAHQIYVCAPNCARGVILTAAEMNAMDRISWISLAEEDLYSGEMEALIIDGVTEIIGKLRYRPSVILLFTVCVHHFMGTDLSYVYETLRGRFPTLPIVDCFMDPIMQKGGLSPDQKLRIAMYSCLQPRPKEAKSVNLIGNDLRIYGKCELLTQLTGHGYQVRDITRCETYEEYLAMGSSRVNIVSYPSARAGGEALSKRLHMDCVYLPQIWNYKKLFRMEESLCRRLDIPPPAPEPLIEICEGKLREAREAAGNRPVALDSAAVPYVLSLSRFLLEHGFRVERIYADSFLPEEEEDFYWHKTQVPQTLLYPTTEVRMRTVKRKTEESCVAIGQKAAYFTGTSYFVNMVEGGGLLGLLGMASLADWITKAAGTPKNPRELVIRKGLGCVSCI